jgi:hypothetical protein
MAPAGLLPGVGLLNLYLAFRFYRRYQRLLERRVRRHTRDLAAEFRSAWEETLTGFSETLRQLRRDIQEQI